MDIKKNNRVTLRQLAKEAGVSMQTISRHINKSGSVSKETAEVIELAIQKLNYYPNPA